MIIYKCDICKNKTNSIDTIVLYKEKLDYCKECKAKANKIKRAMKNSLQYYNKKMDEELREVEKSILSRRY